MEENECPDCGEFYEVCEVCGSERCNNCGNGCECDDDDDKETISERNYDESENDED